MGDDQDRSSLGVQLAEQVHHGTAGAGIEVAGRFVGQHDRRSVDDRTGDGDALPFATRHLARRVRQSLTEADATQGLRGRLAPIDRRLAAVQQPIGDVVDRGHSFEEEERLEDEPDQVRTHAGQLTIAHRRGVDAGDADDPAGRPIERADDVQQRRLAGARRPDDRRQFAVAHFERHRVEGTDRRLAGVLLDDVDQLERQLAPVTLGLRDRS